MFKLIRLTWVPVALVLSACDVQVRDETPAEYPANHDIGMYDIKATVTRDALVTPGSVFLFALGNNGAAQFWESLPDSAGAPVPHLGCNFIY